MGVRSCLLIATTLLVRAVIGQEICDNGIDDDADGLIDLNDTLDCACTGAAIPVLGYIPNPSFEDYDCLPASYSQLDCADSWAQATLATTDYFYSGSYMPAWVPQPLPGGGNACAGGYVCHDYMEYIGGCLTQPLQPGTSYDLKMSIASFEIDNFLSQTTTLDLSPIDITIYGLATCPSWPANVVLCPGNEGWVELGHTTYSPSSAWSDLMINFTPTIPVQAIMFGSPCTLPADYPNVFDPWLAYFIYDDLELSVYDGQWIPLETAGSLCDPGELLIVHPPPDGSDFQWYLDGVALPGATDTVLLISDPINGPGFYQFRCSTDSSCAGASHVVVTPELPASAILAIQGQLFCTGSGSYSWFLDGLEIPGATGQSFTPALNGTYQVQVTGENGCVSLSEPFLLLNVGVPGPGVVQPSLMISWVTDRLRISGIIEPVELWLFDATGKCCLHDRVTGGSWTCNTSWLPAGIFLLKVGDRTVRFVH